MKKNEIFILDLEEENNYFTNNQEQRILPELNFPNLQEL